MTDAEKKQQVEELFIRIRDYKFMVQRGMSKEYAGINSGLLEHIAQMDNEVLMALTAE